MFEALLQSIQELTAGEKSSAVLADINTPEFKKWFGNSKVVDEHGKPLIVHHGTNKEFYKFRLRIGDVGIHFGTYGQAEDRILYKQMHDPNAVQSIRTVPVYLSIWNPLRLQDAGAWTPDNVGFQLEALFPDNIQQIKRFKSTKDLREFIQSKGYDGIVYKNTGEVAGGLSYAKKQSELSQQLAISQKKRGKSFSCYDAEDRQTPEYKAYAKAVRDYEDFREKNAEDSYIVFSPKDIKSIYNKGTFNPNSNNIYEERIVETNLNANFRKWFKKSKVVDNTGKPLKVYHGTSRADRVGDRFIKGRATSGPMPFFTDDPSVASGYAEGKKDTSIEVESLADYFSYKGTTGLDKIWRKLSYSQQKEFINKVYKIGKDEDTNEIRIMSEDEAPISKDYWDYVYADNKRNGLMAIFDYWVNSGILYDDIDSFLKILALAGLPEIKYDDPFATYPGVIPVYLSIQNPLDTGSIPTSVVEALEEESEGKTSKYQSSLGMDVWDKNLRGGDWVDVLKDDIDKGTTTAWTSIPDWVTDTLQKLGYDGIKDTGGKFGGVKHVVWIPFESNQIKSVYNKGTWNPNSDNISELKKQNEALESITNFFEGEQIKPSSIDTPEFKRWFSGSKIVDDQGKPLVVYHGSDEERAEPEGYMYFTDNPSEAVDYAWLKYLQRYVENNRELEDLFADVMTDEGAESLTDMSLDQIINIIDANGFEVPEQEEAKVITCYLKAVKPLDLTQFGSSIGSEEKLWKALYSLGLLEDSWDEFDEEAIGDIESQYEDKAFYKFLEDEGIINKAFLKGYDCVIFMDQGLSGKTVHKTFVVQEAKNIKSIYNKGTWNPNSNNIYESIQVVNKFFEQEQTANINTPEFKRWFGNSKVVDGNGKPLVVYHGTNKKFKVFNFKSSLQKIIWFTTNREEIERGEAGAAGTSIIMPLYISLQKPAGWNEYEKFGLDALQRDGFDGAILPNTDGSFSGFVFNPNQIKSIYNKGTWNPNSNNIYETITNFFLNESKSSVKTKYLNTGKITQQEYDYFLSADPTKDSNAKYFEWMIRLFVRLGLYPPANAVALFTTLNQGIEKNQIKKKDINQYEDWNEVITTVEEYQQLSRGLQALEVGDLEKGKDFEVVEENNNATVVKVNNYKASNILGSSTWCIQNQEKYWNQYENDGVTFYFVFNKKQTNSKTNSVWAIGYLDKAYKAKADHWLEIFDGLNNKDYSNMKMPNAKAYEYLMSLGLSYNFEIGVKEGLNNMNPEVELKLALESPEKAYLYAKNVIKGRFELGEEAISKNAYSSFYYALDVLKPLGIDRFELGEEAISKDAEYSYFYALYVLKSRFEQGEEAISKDAHYSYRYALNVLKPLGIDRFEEGEEAISKDANSSYAYAKSVIKGRFELGELVISKDAKYSYYYARDVIKGRFEKGEEAISEEAINFSNNIYSELYVKFLKNRGIPIPDIFKQNESFKVEMGVDPFIYNLQNDIDEVLKESSLSRVYKHWQDTTEGNQSYAMLTSQRSIKHYPGLTKSQWESEQRKRWELLSSDLKRMGLSWIVAEGRSEEEFEENGITKTIKVKEPSMFILGITWKQAVELAKKFNQDTFIYAGPETGGKVWLADQTEKSVAKFPEFKAGRIAQFYSKVKGRPFYFE